ncbi:MAG: branched-chain amino acid ABC transporter permease [Solirubrobacteraceae bacterium]
MTGTANSRTSKAPPSSTRGVTGQLLMRLTHPAPTPQPRTHRRLAGRAAVAALLLIFAAIPFASFHIPVILPGPTDIVNSVGTLDVLGLCFVFAAVALSYDILLGFTGLLSFGHALYFAVGAYTFDIALTQWNLAVLPALAVTAGVSLFLAIVLGVVSLRVNGIAFSMITLAFAQAVYYVIQDNPGNLTGGATGLVLSTTHLPSLLVGVSNTRYLYWLTLAFLVVIFALTWLLTESAMGRVWVAIRENEQRVEVLGLRPLQFKLASIVASSLIATAGGVVYLLFVGAAAPDAVASTTVTVSLLVMVILGGVGRRSGAVVGAIVYVYLQQYLLKIAAEPSFASLPGPLRVPLSQPSFLLGAIFIVFVLFAPGGIIGLVDRVRLARAR